MDLHSHFPRGRGRPSRRLAGLMIAAPALLAATLALAQADSAAPAAPAPGAPVSNSRLDAPLFYQLLLGELSLGVNDPAAGYALFLEAARRDRDPALYRRAIEIALQGRAGESALAAARDWMRDMPSSAEAPRFALQIQLALNQPADSAPVLRAIIDRAPAGARVDTINAIPQAYARVTDKALALQEARKALSGQLNRADTGPAAWTTIGRLHLSANQIAPALDAAQRGIRLDPASPFPALLAVELMERGQTEAEALVRRHLAAPAAPAESPARLAYARLLLDINRPDDARAQLQQVTAARPALAEPWLLLASVQLQENADAEAQASLERYVQLAGQPPNDAPDSRNGPSLTQAYLMQAQLAEKRGDYPAANAWLDRIENSAEIMAAQMRRASMLARQGRVGEARALLREFPESRPEVGRLKLVAEAQLLRDFKAWSEAYEVYGQAVARFPKDTDLLYDQSMMADRAGRHEDAERLLQQLIEADPEHHHAYNALGYGMADRGVRLDEAKALIEKAVSMAPDDPYIQDSLAWVEYRLGNVPRALDILRAAYASRPDPEIAAHLGEILWVSGRRDEALRIWKEGLTLASDNETLQSTLQRFKVQP